MHFLRNILKLKPFRSREIPIASLSNTAIQADKLTLCEDVDGVRTITLNHPSKRNALSYDLLKSLQDDLHRQTSTHPLSAVVIKASGKVFSSGHNLKELTNADIAHKTFDLCSEIMIEFQEHAVPVIAQVQGLATAAGCQLVASCDIAVAAASARFATPGVSNSIFCTTPGVALARSVPCKTALYMLLTAEAITAMEALQCGLVSRVVPDEDLETETQRIVGKIKASSRPVIRLGKQSFYQQRQLPLKQAYKFGGERMVENLKYDDAQEGINAFVLKRKPNWSHRE